MKKGVIACLALLLTLLCEGIGTTALAQGKPSSKELHVLNWENYFGTTTLRDFEKESGVKIILTTFDDEDQMMSMVQSNPAKYDVIIASGDQILEMIGSRLLAEINLDNIPNFKNVEGKYRNPLYDPGNRHSVPYLWGTTGLIVNRKYINEDVDSWAVLFNPKYKGKIGMLDNYDEVIAAGLKALGYSINSNDPEELEEARRILVEQKPLLAGYMSSEKLKDKMIANELWVAHQYSGEGVFSMDKNSVLEYIIPTEGAAVWVDTLAIPRDSPNKETAEAFINFILDARVSAKIANYQWYANCNIAARPYTLKEVLIHPSLYPSQEVLDRLEFFRTDPDVEKERLGVGIRNSIWSELSR